MAVNAAALSQSATMAPLFGCLVEAERFLGPGREWFPRADELTEDSYQARFLQLFRKGRSGISAVPESKSFASREYSEVMGFLRKHGSSLVLPKWNPIIEFGMASILDVLVAWLVPGKVSTVTYNNRSYPAAKLGKSGVGLFQSSSHQYPVVQIMTQSGDVVRLTAHPRPLYGFDLLNFIEGVSSTLDGHCSGYAGVIFPMLNYKEDIDVSGIEGIRTRDQLCNPVRVAKAIQRTIFRMNQIGARAQSEAGMVAQAIGVSASPLVIDQPFVVSIHRPDLAFPLFAGWFNTDTWADPGNLD